jgi:hypothetical protein
MPSDGTIGGLVGKLDVLRIECPTYGRQDRYHVARLIEETRARLTTDGLACLSARRPAR